VLLLPNGITEHLAPAHLDAILAHELCHVRYRDNLAAAIHMTVEAIFWFHPLVWWLGARLIDERERACDEEVLSLGNQPEIYAESILRTCEFYLQSPMACMSGITGSDLKKRIGRIMIGRISNNLEMGKKLLLTGVGFAAVAGPLVFGMLNAAPKQTVPQTSQSLVTRSHSFEVASIKPDKSSAPAMRLHFEPDGRFHAETIPFKMIIEEAYGIKDAQLIGAPSWLGSERYDIQAKPEDSVVEEMRKVTPEQRKDIMMQMIRGMLQDRCKLTLRYETRDLPIYSMVVAKGGPKFHEIAASADAALPPGPPERMGSPNPLKGGVWMRGRGEVTVSDSSLPMFVNALSMQLGRPVVDNTGLIGKYEFTLKWTPEEEGPQMFGGVGGPDSRPPTDAPPPPDVNGPSLFTAMQEQLGLKLEAKTAPMQVLVIDHIERPSEN
jgi:uncharacterized protein (TIGR03435 family)